MKKVEACAAIGCFCALDTALFEQAAQKAPHEA
jgi:hypothetical protein